MVCSPLGCSPVLLLYLPRLRSLLATTAVAEGRRAGPEVWEMAAPNRMKGRAPTTGITCAKQWKGEGLQNDGCVDTIMGDVLGLRACGHGG